MSEKSGYTEQLANWVKRKTAKGKRQDAAAVSFLAVKPKVEEAINNGYSMKTIWEHMRDSGMVECNYDSFRKYVKKFIGKEQRPAADPGGDTPKNNEPQEQEGNKEPTVTKPKGNTFEFEAKPNRKELY